MAISSALGAVSASSVNSDVSIWERPMGRRTIHRKGSDQCILTNSNSAANDQWAINKFHVFIRPNLCRDRILLE